MKNYKELLKDPRWAFKRMNILVRDQYQCQNCQAIGCGFFGENKDRRLDVHHISYGPTPWDVPDKDLITLCGECHTAEHK